MEGRLPSRHYRQGAVIRSPCLVVVLPQQADMAVRMLLSGDKLALLKPDESGYNLVKNAHARRCAPEGRKGYLLVQNRAEWKQLVAGAAHLCKERVPECLG